MRQSASRTSISSSTSSKVSFVSVSPPRARWSMQFRQNPRPTWAVDPHCSHAATPLLIRMEAEMSHVLIDQLRGASRQSRAEVAQLFVNVLRFVYGLRHFLAK